MRSLEARCWSMNSQVSGVQAKIHRVIGTHKEEGRQEALDFADGAHQDHKEGLLRAQYLALHLAKDRPSLDVERLPDGHPALETTNSQAMYRSFAMLVDEMQISGDEDWPDSKDLLAAKLSGFGFGHAKPRSSTTPYLKMVQTTCMLEGEQCSNKQLPSCLEQPKLVWTVWRPMPLAAGSEDAHQEWHEIADTASNLRLH